MKHMTEEDLIAYREGVADERPEIAGHLAVCEECRAELERIEAVLAALDTLPVPDPGDDYGRRVWQEIAPRLPEKPRQWWRPWFEAKRPAQKHVNISAEQRRAEDLLDENRLYRQTAVQEGDTALASVLDELERVLLDVAHSPEEVTPAQLEKIRQKIEARGILFKVRVVGRELQERQKATTPAPGQHHSSPKSERNKA